MDAPFVREILRDGQIVCYRLYDMSGAGMEAWRNDAVAFIRTWPNHKPLLSLIDIRVRNPIVTAQVLLNARQVAATRSGLFGRAAILVASPLGAQVFSSLVRTTLSEGIRERRVFSNEARAISWLLEKA